MNRILPCLVAFVVLIALSSCVTNQKPAGSAAMVQANSALPATCVKPYFRLNMGVTYGPLAPTTPKPIAPDVIWQDVAIWQTFLNTHTPFHCANPPTDSFQGPEMNATVLFQLSAIGGAPVFPSGYVDAATFAKARTAGLANYCTVTTSVNEAERHRRSYVKHHAEPATN